MILKYYTQMGNEHTPSNLHLIDSHIYSMHTHRHILLVQQFKGQVPPSTSDQCYCNGQLPAQLR